MSRCQGLTKFRPVYGTYGGLGGDVKDRMRCTHEAVTTIEGVDLCEIHTINQETIRHQLKCAWKKPKP